MRGNRVEDLIKQVKDKDRRRRKLSNTDESSQEKRSIFENHLVSQLSLQGGVMIRFITFKPKR